MNDLASTNVPLALESHHVIGDWSDRVAFGITRSLRFLADTFFAKRYGNRAIVLEVLYVVSSRTAHRLAGYFEEQAVISYTQYLLEIDEGRVDNVAAPPIAIDYWRLPANARLREVVVAVREDEVGHRDVNHGFADSLRLAVPLRMHDIV